MNPSVPRRSPRPSFVPHSERATRAIGVLIGALQVVLALTCGTVSAEDSIPLGGRRVAGLRLAAGAEAVAHIDSPTRVQYFVGQGDKWKPASVTIDSPLLVPGAPLALVALEGEELPQVLSIGAAGRFVEVTPRKAGLEVALVAESLIPSSIEFPPGGDFTVARRSKRPSVFAISRDGTLWEFDPQAAASMKIEARPGLLPPGGTIRSMRDAGDELFLVDRRGNLVSYVRDPVVRWKGPRLIGTGFVAGSDLVVWRRPDNKNDLQVAAVNAAGELEVGRLETHGWKLEIAPGWVLPPGTSVGVAHTPVNLRLCAVSARGALPEMTLVNTEWRERPVAGGFAWRSSVVFLPNGPVAMGVDVAGNLISATHTEEIWSSFVTTTDPAVETARLAEREWKRSPSPPPMEISFVNNSADELIVRIRNRLKPADAIEKTVAPSAALPFEVESDSAGELVDLRRYTAADGTKTEQTKSVPTFPQGLYDIEVLTLRENTIPYIDLRQNPWPPVSQRGKSPISLGSFAIPPGAALSAGARVDLLRSVEDRRLSLVGP